MTAGTTGALTGLSWRSRKKEIDLLPSLPSSLFQWPPGLPPLDPSFYSPTAPQIQALGQLTIAHFVGLSGPFLLWLLRKPSRGSALKWEGRLLTNSHAGSMFPQEWKYGHLIGGKKPLHSHRNQFWRVEFEASKMNQEREMFCGAEGFQHQISGFGLGSTLSLKNCVLLGNLSNHSEIWLFITIK